MNRIYKIFLLFFLFSNLFSFGQRSNSDSLSKFLPILPKKTSIGIIGGPNLFNSMPKPEPFELGVGVCAGLSFQYNFKKHSFIVADLLVERKTYSYNSYYGRNKYDINSVTLPIMYRHGFGKKNIFILNAGIFISNQYSTKNYANYYNKTSKNNVGYTGFVAGLGVRVPVNKKVKLLIEARDYYSWAIIYGKINSSFGNSPLEASNTITLLAGISYGLGKTKDSTNQKISIKPYYSIKNSFRKNPDDNTVIQESTYNTYRYNSEEDIPKICNEAGLLFEIRLSEYFNLNTGLNYDERNFSTNTTKFTFTSNSPWNPSSHIITDELNYKLQFLSLPILINAEKKIKNASIYIGTGIEVKRLLYSSMSFAHERSNIYSSAYKGKEFSYFWDVHVGASLPLSKKLSFFLEPTIENGLNKIYLDQVKVELQLWSYGCRAGLKF